MTKKKRTTVDSRRLRFESLEARQLLAITTIGADADTYIRDSTPRGSSTVLDTMDWNGAGDWTTYVRFDLSGIDIDTITDATLYLYKVPGTQAAFDVPDRFDVYGLTNAVGNTPQNWSEASLDRDSVGAEYSSATGVNTAQVFNLDKEAGADVAEHTGNKLYAPMKLSGPELAAFLNDRVDDNGLATFVTRIDAGNVRGWGYASKEYTDVTLRPSLMIQHSTVAPEVDPYPANPVSFTHQMEDLDRGLVAVKRNGDVLLSWRMLGTDPTDISFNLYRKSNGGSPVKVNGSPITTKTNYVDAPSALQSHEYFVRPIINGIELGPANPDSIPEYATIPIFAPSKYFHEVPLQIPSPINGNPYEANDASVGDLDGDGEYEIVLKWVAAEAPMYLDAYKLDGTQLWRISLGQNISASFTGFPDAMTFSVYDLDGDGKAEVAMNTAPGAKDGLGNWVLEPGDDPNANYVNGSGYAATGPEYFSVFDGETGALLANTDLGPARGTLEDWGDGYGHRATTFQQAVVYLDGVRPSIVVGRGIYHAIGEGNGISTGKTEMTTYNWRDGTLSEVWTFTASYGAPTGNVNPEYVGQGNQQITVGDVDGDGYDEIVWGAMAVDHDGTGLYSTGIGHGDALHMSDMDPTNPGLEVFKPNENASEYADAAAVMFDAMTGEKLVRIPGTGDVGRGVAGDIDPNSPGYELWATTGGSIYAADGTPLYATPSNMFQNFLVWWDGDLTRELLDGTTISEWNNPGRSNFDLSPENGSSQWWAPDTSSNNGTKATPSLAGDIWGDWREEVIWRKSDNTALRIFSTPFETDTRMVTLMHDRMYREAIAWQNGYYNQPPHPSFFLGAGMTTPPSPNIYLASANPATPGDFNLDESVDATDLGIWQQTYGSNPSGGHFGDADNDGDADGFDFLAWQRNAETPNIGRATSGGSGTDTSQALTAAVEEQVIEEQIIVEQSPVASDQIRFSLARDAVFSSVSFSATSRLSSSEVGEREEVGSSEAFAADQPDSLSTLTQSGTIAEQGEVTKLGQNADEQEQLDELAGLEIYWEALR